jgi:hypothetical protein
MGFLRLFTAGDYSEHAISRHKKRTRFQGPFLLL